MGKRKAGPRFNPAHAQILKLAEAIKKVEGAKQAKAAIQPVSDSAMEEILGEAQALHERDGHKSNCRPLYPGGFCEC